MKVVHVVQHVQVSYLYTWYFQCIYIYIHSFSMLMCLEWCWPTSGCGMGRGVGRLRDECEYFVSAGRWHDGLGSLDGSELQTGIFTSQNRADLLRYAYIVPGLPIPKSTVVVLIGNLWAGATKGWQLKLECFHMLLIVCICVFGCRFRSFTQTTRCVFWTSPVQISQVSHILEAVLDRFI